MDWGAAIEQEVRAGGGIQMIRRRALECDDDQPLEDTDETSESIDWRGPSSRTDQVTRRMPPQPIPMPINTPAPTV
ncbi:MAG: hypothetical protein QGG36_13160 [Pirellulaceae bacterium]|jgi:hypothetical protein|nr:hypothetical protein [Pirellulaceae bacterium]MDP7016744.1 hypothetical protein [Pirellulaceae bacterium]